MNGSMNKITLGRALSFPDTFGDDGLPSKLDDVCHYKKETATFYLQSPKLDQLNDVLASYGHVAILDEQGKKSYADACKARVSFDVAKSRFLVMFPQYPSWPLFNRSITKRWTWDNMASQAIKSKPLYWVDHVYQLVEAIPWLEREGYEVTLDKAVKAYFPPVPAPGERICSVTRSGSFEPKPHQIDSVKKMRELGFKGIIGDPAGFGKTISAGEIIDELFHDGKVSRALWVVPTSPLVTQVLEEMEGRYGLVGTPVTGETVKPAERLGTVKGKPSGDTIYEKHGFVVMTWAMFVKDFTGKTFHEITKRVHFDLAVFDEGHRSQHGNKAREAVLNMSAPYRIILSGTIMPNGDWRELHAMVSSVSPSSVMAPWYFMNIEARLEEDFKVTKDVAHPRHDAKKRVSSMVLPMLLKHVARHPETDQPSFMPALATVSLHVQTTKTEEAIIDREIALLSRVIEEWQSCRSLQYGSKDDKRFYKMMENAKNVVWSDLRRFCSHGSFRLKDRMNSILSESSPVNDWLRGNYTREINEIVALLSKPDVRDQPKNERVLSALDQSRPERCIVFYDSVRGAIELAKFLKDNDKSVRVIVGAYDQFEPGEADELGQSNHIGDEEIENILEWFWFPWKTISKIPAIVGSDMDVTFVSSTGERKKAVYYVDAYKLGNHFTIEITSRAGMKVSDRVAGQLAEKLKSLFSSPAVKVNVTVGGSNDKNMVMLDITITGKKDRRVLVTTDKLNEGANLQVANFMIFYDAPLSIKQREQRMARARRMESRYKTVAVISILLGLDYAIDRALGMKYEMAERLGYPDANPVSMKEVLALVKRGIKKPEKEQPSLLSFAAGDDE